MVKNKAMMEVNSSIKLFFALSDKWIEVITKRQKPSSVADVFNICWEVLFAIDIISYNVEVKRLLLSIFIGRKLPNQKQKTILAIVYI